MIVQAILNWLSAGLAAVLGAIPALPDALSDRMLALPGQLQDIADGLGVLGPVVPFSSINAAFDIVVSGFALGFVLWLVMKALSMFTGGGGK